MSGFFGTPSKAQASTPQQDEGKAFQNRVLLERFNMVIEFMNVKLGEGWNGDTPVERPHDLLHSLKDGSALCKLVSVGPAQTGSDEERTKANLHQFRREATRLGLPESSLFGAGDLLQPSSLSAICVVNCLQELRIKLLEMDRALLNEHYSSPSRETRHKVLHSGQMLVRPVDAVGRDGSPMTRPASRGVLDLLGENEAAAPHTPQQQLVADDASAAGSGRKMRSSSKRAGRRVSINTLNTQASLARVQERMASTYKDKCKQLEAGNQELVEAVEDLQDTVASLQRSKHSYQLECEKLQDRNRVMLSHFRLMEAQIKACTEAWKSCNVSTEEHPTLREVDEEMNTLKMTWDDVNEATEAVQQEAARGVAEQDRRAVEDSIDEGDEEDEDEHDQGSKVQPADAPAAAGSKHNAQVDDLCEKLFTLNISKEEYQETKAELSRTKDILRKTKDHVFALQKELQMEKESHAEAVKQLRDKLSTLKFEFADLSNDFRGAFSNSAASFANMAKTLQKRVADCDARRKDAQARFCKEEKRRKQLLNMVHNLKGNIRVMCRIRPVLSGDLEKEDSNVAIEPVDDERLTIATSVTSAAGTVSTKANEYEFDRVFGPTSSQESVFDEVSPLVESVMDGFHSCIFAYGQTGSGKTYTMSGDGAENRGINYLALEELFRANAQRRAGGAHYRFKVQNVEIYCEKVIDLLASHPDQGEIVAEEKSSGPGSSGPAYLEIRANDRDGVHMPGCVEIEVKDVDEVIEVMELGARNRSSAHTKMNMASSRSHSVVIVSVHGANDETGRNTFGKLVLVDLAGSERLAKSGVQGVQLKEAQAINKSLSCLGDVISALESKAAHVPFRNSKLTTLLQDSLGKDNKALMILQVSPTTYNVQESTCSLNFAARVRQCELGKAKKKERVGESSKQRAAMKQAQDRTHQLELKVKMLNKKLEEARIEQESIRAQAAKDADKLTKRLEDRFATLKETDSQEIKALRGKLQDRQSEDADHVAKLEAEVHAAKMEIANLKQQLRSSIAGSSMSAPVHAPIAPSSSTSSSASASAVASVAASTSASSAAARAAAARRVKPRSTAGPSATSRATPPRTATAMSSPAARSVSSQDGGLRERRKSVDNVQKDVSSPDPSQTAKDQAKKQVSWKNTPQVIPPSDKKAARQRAASEDENASPDRAEAPRVPATIRLANTATVASKARAATSSLGTASRVLQTPARAAKPAVRTARRVPTRRPVWQ